MFTEQDIYKLLEEVSDPEIPVLSILDLGIVRGVYITEDKTEIQITPTYSGCPAMDTITQDILNILQKHNIPNVSVTLVLTPAWTTDWLTPEGIHKLEVYGICPPAQKSSSKKSIFSGTAPVVKCPRCKSTETHLISLFGSTACKALYKCSACLEPFDYFKCL